MAPAPIPTSLLLLCGRLARHSPEAVGRSLEHALLQSGLASERLPVEDWSPAGEAAREVLALVSFETRMLAARAVVLVLEQLSPETLAGSLAFEVATRARQAGVPAYAIAGHSSLSLFDERILDLQLVLRARGPAGLAAAAARIAAVA